MHAMAATSDNTALRRLADLVKQRRNQLRLHKIDVATAADIAINTYNKIEAGESVRDVTYSKIEPVLKWPLGACRDILAGATAVPTVDDTASLGVAFVALPQEELEVEVQQAVQSAMIAGTELPAGEIRKVNELVIEQLRRRGVLPKHD